MKPQLLQPIQHRFSPLIFNEEPVRQEDLETLFEAASWAASSYNAQPWIFIYERKGTEGFAVLQSLLTDYNIHWTSSAQILMLSVSKVIDDKGRENYYALYDLGQAVSSMAIQASSMGIQIHQMGGFDRIKARETLGIPSEYQIGSMIALGYPGDIEKLEEPFKERASGQRIRKEVHDISAHTDVFSK